MLVVGTEEMLLVTETGVVGICGIVISVVFVNNDGVST